MKKFALASLAALTLCAPVAAANFSGPSVEAQIAWDRVQAKLSYADDSAKGHDNGAAYGIGIGYDYRSNWSVVGAFASIGDSSIKECLADGTERGCLSVGRDIEAGARFGGVVGKKALVYVKAAYADTRAGVSYSDSAAPADNFSEHDHRSGLRVGAGVEYAVTPHVYAKAEYRYTDYKNLHADVGGDVAKLALSRHQVLGAIGYRF